MSELVKEVNNDLANRIKQIQNSNSYDEYVIDSHRIKIEKAYPAYFGTYDKIEDIKMLINIINHKRNGEPLSDKFFKTPFKKPELIYDWKAPEKK